MAKDILIQKKRIKYWLFIAAIVIIYSWSIKGTEVSFSTFVNGIPYMIDYIGRMFPPDLKILPLVGVKMIETLQIAIMGTTIGVLLAFPLSFLGSRNIISNRFFYHLLRSIFDFSRGINEIVWALLFVAMVGLGAFSGILALSIHVIGALGKYFSEAIENVDEDIIMSIKSTGASKLQVILNGIFPQVKPLFIGYIFYYFEHNIRAATVLGLVGAGGIGFELMTSIKLFKYHEVLTIILAMVVLVVVVDRLSAYIRNKFILG